MPITVEQIVEEASQLPREQVAELVDRLTLKLHQAEDSATDSSWKKEIRRRVAEIESGAVQGVPGDEVSARIRTLLGR